MQVVYSGGSTPSPSPRIQRKQYQGGYGRHVFIAHPICKNTPQLARRAASADKKETVDNDSALRDSIPAMTKSVAITCLVLNILLPGLGKLSVCIFLLKTCYISLRLTLDVNDKTNSKTYVENVQFI